MSLTPEEIRAQNLKLVEQSLYHSADSEGTEDIYAVDCKFHQPFFFPGRITLINPSETGEILAHEDTVAIFKDWKYDPSTQQIYTTQDPDTIIVTNSGEGLVLRADGQYYPYRNSYVHVFKCANGKIAEYYEYTNPLNLMDAFGMEHPVLPTPEETNEEYAKLGIL